MDAKLELLAHQAGMAVEFFREARWLNAARVRAYLLLFAAANLIVPVFLIATSHEGVDRNGFLLGTDFLSFWTVGTMLHHGADVYDVPSFIAAQRAFHAQSHAYTAFFYPPVFLAWCWPLGLLAYFPALALWLTATGAAFFAAVRSWSKRLEVKLSWVGVFGFPATVIVITHGQTTFLVGALLGLGLKLVPERAWLGGVLIGAAAIKPQLALLVPVALLAAGEWRAILGAAASALGFAALSTAAFGWQVWSEWIAVSGPASLAMENGAIGFAKMQSTFAAAMLLGASTHFAYALQFAVAIAATGALALACRGRRMDLELAALTLTGCLLATPFLLDYDLVLLAFPLLFLAAQEARPWERVVTALAFATPAFARPLGVALGLPITPFVLSALFAVQLRRALSDRSRGKTVGA